MAEITAKLVKELREKSGAGVMDAKKALVETDGDIEKAIEAMLDQPMDCVESADLGKASRISDAAGRYIEFCKRDFIRPRKNGIYQ